MGWKASTGGSGTQKPAKFSKVVTLVDAFHGVMPARAVDKSLTNC
jgi:hypothetical protein